MSRFPLAISALTLLLCSSSAMVAEDSTPVPAKTNESKAKDKAKDGKFTMGEVTVVVSANMDPIETANTKIETEQLQELNRDSLSSALEMMPGVSIVSGGARNEAMFYIRGNSPLRAPVFVDGIPCYIPYDGNIDYSRFTTFDVSEIQVAKGFSSISYGANTLGGAVNVVTRKPVKAFEGDVRIGAFDGNGRTAAVNVGSNQGWWYVQASASKSQADYFRMSSHYSAAPVAVLSSSGAATGSTIITEDGGRRDNSYYDDKKISVKVGLTPNATDEYAVGFMRQRGDKGDPVATARLSNSKDMSIHYWQWPMWNMDSTFLATNTAIGASSYVKFRAYFNRYENGIDLFTDGTFTTPYSASGNSYNIGPFFSNTGQSRYKDFTHGLMLELGTMAIANHSLKATVQTKTDVHREGGDSTVTGDTQTWRHYQYRFLSAGVEDSITLNSRMDLALGVGWDQNKPVNAFGFTSLPPTRSLFHGQAGLFWKLTPDTKLYATIAQKDRFATLKELYSKYNGTYTPNPDLKPEKSTNYEVGVKSQPLPWMQLEAAIFRSDITDMIQSVSLGSGLSKQMNIGKVVHQGVELSMNFTPSKYFKGGLGYTYLDRDNKSDSTPLTSTPRNRMTGFAKVSPLEVLYVQASAQAQSQVCDSTTPTYVGGFTTVDVAIGWLPIKPLSFEGGLKNATDKNYEYNTGYPMPGRTWFINGRYKF